MRTPLPQSGAGHPGGESDEKLRSKKLQASKNGGARHAEALPKKSKGDIP